RAGAGVGPAGVEDDGARDPVADGGARPHDGGGDDAVGGEDGGGDGRRAVVDDEGDVLAPAALQPGSDAGGAEAPWGGDGHGATPTAVRPRPSGSPRARFIDWTAAPAVPLPRLSMAHTATTRPARSSTVTWTWAALEPRVAAVVGHCPSARRWTNGSSAEASAQARRTAAASAPAASGAVTVARMPRAMGTSVGVKDSRTSAAPARRRFCSISGMCRWVPPTA